MSCLLIRRAPIAALLLGLAVSCSKPSADEHFKKATDYINASKLDEAIIEYQLALQADVKRGDIHAKLAEAYLAKGDGNNAYKETIRAADLLPNDAQAQLRAGNFILLAASRGQASFDDAKARANKALEIDPKNVEAQILLGSAIAGTGPNDYEAALDRYREALALDPSNDRALTNTGMLKYRQGKKEEAEASFRKAVEVAPKSFPAHLALASFLLETGRTAEAESTLKAALALDPTNVAANRALGSFYMVSKRLKEAEPYFQAIANQTHAGQDTLALADYYLVANRRSEARTVLSQLANDPKFFGVATVRLAVVDALEGNRANARTRLKEVTDKNPKDMSARLLDARLLLLDSKRDEALARATSIVTDDPGSQQAGDAYMLIGGINAEWDRFDEAKKAFQEVLKRQAAPLGADLALAALSLKTLEYDKARTYLQQAETIQPNNPVTRALSIRLLIAQGKSAEASTQLAALQKQYPDAPEVLKLTATQQFAARQYDAARASYTKALQASPNDLEAAAGLIATDLASGKKADAIARVESGLKSGTPSTGLYILAARTYASNGDLVKAEELLHKAIDVDPARLEAYALLGQLYASQRRVPDAIEEYKKITARVPNSVGGNTILGMLYEMQQQTAEAEQQYKKVLSIDPRAAVAANNLAWIYVASNRNLDEALQLAQTALQGLPGEPHVTDTLGWIYYRKDMTTQAVQYLESSVLKNPNDPAGHYHLGMAYVRAGEIDKGRKSLQRALAAKTEFDGIADARKTLAQIGG